MTMSEWAKKEVEIACKKENPEWDGESFDYGCSCYQIVSNDNKFLELQNSNGYIHIDKEDRSLSVNMCVPAKVMRLIYELYNVWGW